MGSMRTRAVKQPVTRAMDAGAGEPVESNHSSLCLCRENPKPARAEAGHHHHSVSCSGFSIQFVRPKTTGPGIQHIVMNVRRVRISMRRRFSVNDVRLSINIICYSLFTVSSVVSAAFAAIDTPSTGAPASADHARTHSLLVRPVFIRRALKSCAG